MGLGFATKIHVDLPEDVHRRLRVKVALTDETIQDYVQELVAEAVKDIHLPPNARGNRRG